MSTEPSKPDDVDLEAWLRAVFAALDLDPDRVDPSTTVPAILDLVRDVAHGVARPAGPLAAFAVGVAVGTRGLAPVAGCERARTVIDGFGPPS
jgi:hypothetical protein